MAEKVTKSKKKITINKKRLVISIVILAVVIALIIGLVVFLNVQKYKKYEPYEAKMKLYGFDRLYDNKSAKSSEKVTNAEAIKIIISATLNKNDISDYFTTDLTYKDAQYIEYAKEKVIFRDDAITQKNLNSRVRYIDIIEYISNAKTKLLEKELLRDADVKYKDYDKYDKFQKRAILDIVSSELIENTNKNLDGNRKIAKGELNELIIKFVEKYNIISNGQTVETDESKLPSNAKDYPYIAQGVDKQVYEQPFHIESTLDELNPAELFTYRKDTYNTLKSMSEKYYNVLLNIDYNTITEESFKANISAFSMGDVSDEDIKQYVEYVKNNKIQITGNATVQLPAVYNDGYFTRVRIKLDFEVKNTNTRDNILFMDLTDTTNRYIYNDNKYSIYIDGRMSNSSFTMDLFNHRNVIYDLLLDMSKNNIKQEKVGE